MVILTYIEYEIKNKTTNSWKGMNFNNQIKKETMIDHGKQNSKQNK